MDKTAIEKGHIAYGANAFNNRACEEYEVAVKALDKLCERMMGNYRGSGNGTSTSSHGSVTTPRLTSSLSSISMNQGIITQTPGTILPGNPYVRTLSLLHCETAAAIQEINAPAADIPMESIKTMTPSNGKQGNIITVLKTLLNQGIVEPICQFHTCLVSNKQE